MHRPKRFAFPALRKVSDLIHRGRPLLAHYVSENDEHYLFHWLEGDLLYNRWLVCRVRFEQLLRYTERPVTLRNLFKAPPDGFLYAVDTDNGTDLQVSNVQIVFPSELPDKRLPAADSLYSGQPQTQSVDLLELSRKYDSALLQVHFSESPQVGYGTVGLSLLAPVTHHLQEMAEGLGYSYLRRQTDSRHLSGKFARDDHRKLVAGAASYELVGTLPGSFSLLLRPRNRQMALAGQETEPDKFGRHWREFMEASFELEKLKTAAAQTDSTVMASYQSLLRLIAGTRLRLQLRWANHQTGLQWNFVLDHQQAGGILDNINQLEYLSDVTLRLKGKFTALNVRTNMYSFVADGGKETSKGYVATALHHTVPLIFFSRKYEVVIQRIEVKQAGKAKPRVKDLLIALTEVNAPNRTLFRPDSGLLAEPF